MENEINNRVRELIKAENITQKLFCEVIGVSVDTLNTSFKRDSTPGSDLLIKISEKFPQYSMNWLLTGKGEMEMTNKSVIYNDSKLQEENDKLKQEYDAEIRYCNEIFKENRELRIEIDSLKEEIEKIKKGQPAENESTRQAATTR